MAIITGTYDQLAAQRVLDETSNAIDAALTLYEKHQPNTLEAAAKLVTAYGTVTPGAFDTISQAFDIYWQLRDTACD